VIRLDSTVTAAMIHAPSDSSLLWDAVRVMTRLLREADTLSGGTLVWSNHQRAAKKRARKIRFTRGRPNRVEHYRELIKIARLTLNYLEAAAEQLRHLPDPRVALWQFELCHYRPLIERTIRQSERRVLCGEQVPASEKIVSLFEPHADIIVKGNRDAEYGHKLNLTTGRSGLILDLVIESGNPADSERFLPMLERHIAIYGEAPRQAAADGGYANRHNLTQAKALGVTDMAFHKKAGLRIEDMVKSAGSIASCATSAPVSRQASHASSAPMAWRAAPGVGSTTSRPTSGPQWSLLTSPSSPASSQSDLSALAATQQSSTRLSPDRSPLPPSNATGLLLSSRPPNQSYRTAKHYHVIPQPA
jgi:IS5 family transposase